jgi:hypothetical protein
VRKLQKHGKLANISNQSLGDVSQSLRRGGGGGGGLGKAYGLVVGINFPL